MTKEKNGAQEPAIDAQHDETGRMWHGPRSAIPPRYSEVSPAPAADLVRRLRGEWTGWIAAYRVMHEAGDAIASRDQRIAELEAKAQVMHDLHDALGVAWGSDPYARIKELQAAERRADAAEGALLARDEQVLDLCARLDLSGERAKLDTEDGAMSYFQTVSMNIGCARVVIEQTRGKDYYGERYSAYTAEDNAVIAAQDASANAPAPTAAPASSRPKDRADHDK